MIAPPFCRCLPHGGQRHRALRIHQQRNAEVSVAIGGAEGETRTGNFIGEDCLAGVVF